MAVLLLWTGKRQKELKNYCYEWIAWWLFFTFLLSTYLCINLWTSLLRAKIKKTYFINIYIFSFGVISPPRPPQQRISLNQVCSTTVQVSIAREYETRLVCFFCIHFIFLQIKVAFHWKISTVLLFYIFAWQKTQYAGECCLKRFAKSWLNFALSSVCLNRRLSIISVN